MFSQEAHQSSCANDAIHSLVFYFYEGFLLVISSSRFIPDNPDSSAMGILYLILGTWLFACWIRNQKFSCLYFLNIQFFSYVQKNALIKAPKNLPSPPHIHRNLPL
jgi:hypothetical protein